MNMIDIQNRKFRESKKLLIFYFQLLALNI